MGIVFDDWMPVTHRRAIRTTNLLERLPLSDLLNSDTSHSACLTDSIFLPQQGNQIIGNDCVLMGIAGPTGELRKPGSAATVHCFAKDSPVFPTVSSSTSTIPTTPFHGGQQLALFNAHYDEYCFQPIHIFEATTGNARL